MVSSEPIPLPAVRDAAISRDANEVGAAIKLVERGIAARVTLVSLEFADEALAVLARPADIRISRSSQVGGRRSVIVERSQT